MSEKRRQDLVYPPGPETQREQRKEGHWPEVGVATKTGRLFARFSFIPQNDEAILQVLRQVPYIDRLHARTALFQALGGQYANAGTRVLALCERVFGSDTMYFPGEREYVERNDPLSPDRHPPSRPVDPEPKPKPAQDLEAAFDQGRIQTLCDLLKRLVSQPPVPPAPEILTLLDAAESHIAKAALSHLNWTLLPGEDRYGKTYYQSLQQAAGETVSDHLTGRREMIERMLPGWHKAGRPKNPPPLPLETRLLHRKAQLGVSLLLGSWDKSVTPEAKAQRHSEAEERLAEDHPALAVLGQGGGEPLPEDVLGRMNRLFGHDFSHVRIHTDARAAEAAQLLGARALAFGTHVYFGAGQFAPGTPVGDRLLAHELVHVVQFDEGRLPRGERLSQPSDPVEQEARAFEAQVPPTVADERSPRATADVSTRHPAKEPSRPAIPLLPAGAAGRSGTLLRSGEGVYDEAAGVCRPWQEGDPQIAEASARMDGRHKLEGIIQYTIEQLGPEVGAQLRVLLQPNVIASMLALIIAAMAAQLTPAGWIMDAALGAWAFWSLGMVAIEAFREFVAFARGFSNASSDRELRAAGRHMARFISLVGVNVALALLLRRANRRISERAAGMGGGGRVMAPAGGRGSIVGARIEVLSNGRILIVTTAQVGFASTVSMMTSGHGEGGGGEDDRNDASGRPQSQEQASQQPRRTAHGEQRRGGRSAYRHGVK